MTDDNLPSEEQQAQIQTETQEETISTETETTETETTETTPQQPSEATETPTSETNTNTNTKDQNTTTPRKSVSFNDEGHSELLIEQIEELDVDALWFTPDDYFEIKAQSRLDAKDWRRKGYGVLLKETFENPSDQAQDYLNAFCQLEGPLTRRGLERHLSRRHGEERSDLKDRARYCVLSHQRRLQRDGMPLHEMEDSLSKIYQDMCRTAKVFARRLAKADEYVLQQGETNEAANAIVEDSEPLDLVSGRKMERRLSNFSVKSGSSYDSFRLPPNSNMVPRSIGNHTYSPNTNNNNNANNNMPPIARKPTTPKVPSASKPEEFYAAIA